MDGTMNSPVRESVCILLAAPVGRDAGSVIQERIDKLAEYGGMVDARDLSLGGRLVR